MRSCSVPGVGNSNCRQHSILQSLQVRINRAAALRKRCCCCSWGCSYGSSFTSLPYVRNHDQSSLVRAAAIEDIGSTSPAQTRIQSSAKQVKWTQQPMVKAPTQQHASKQKPVQRKGLHRHPPTKTSLQPSLRSAGLSQVSQDAPAATKDTRIQLRLSQLETGSRKHDPASCHRAVQALKLLVEGTSVDQLLADASLTLLKGWWRKLNQDAKATVSNQSGWRGSPQTCMIGDQPVSNARSQGSSSKQSLMPDAEQLHAKLLHIAQEMQPEQRVDLFLHRYHPRLVQLWLATGHQGWAQEYVAMLPPVLPTATYNAFVASCGKHHSSKTLDVVLQAQQASGLVLTRFATRAAIAVYDKEHNLSAVLRLFEKAVASMEADTDIYTDTMASCFASSKFEVGFDVYDRLKRSGLELTLHSFHTALRGSSYLKAAGVQEVYAHLRSQPKVTPRERTFAYVFRAVASCGGGLPASWIIEVLADMHSCSVKMNSHIFTAFLQAATTVTLSPEQVEAVFGAMASYRACQPPTAFVYTAFLTFCAKRAPDRALDVWHAMQEDGVAASSHLFSSLFAACAAAGTQEMLEAADRSHMDMEGLWNKICSKGKTATEERDMLQAHNALLHVYATHGLVGKAKQLFSSMQERGPAVDSVSAGTLIAAYAKVADHEAALGVFRETKAAGLQPTAPCYTSLLAACARAGDLSSARGVFKSMHVPPSVEAYTALMDACLKKKTPAALAEAFQVFQEMKAVGNLKPTATTYGCLLKVCGLRKDVATAFKLYEEAFEVGVLATDECHNMLIDVCSDAGRLDEAIELVKALASKHGSMKQATLNSLIRSLADVAQVGRALRLLSIMLNMGLKSYRSTTNALIAGCARAFRSVEAASLYWGLREQGGEASKAAGSELIISLCKAGDRLEALKVYEDMTSPTPPPPGTLHQTQKKGVSKSAAKQQRAKQQQQQADAAAAVGAAATAVVASKQQQAGYCASDQEQARLDSHRSDASTQHQQAAADLSAVEDTPARERPLYQTAKPSAEASVHDLPAASGNSQSCSRADAQTAPRATPPSRLTEPSTDPVPSSEQATAPDCTHHQHSDSQATKPIPVHSSSSDSSISNLASRPAGDTLLLKPNRPQPPEPTATPPTSSVSSQASDLPLQDNPALLQHHPDLLQTSSPNPHSSAQSPSRFTNGSGIGLGSGGDKGKRGAGPQAEGVLAKRPVAPVSSSDGGRRPAKLLGSLKLSKRAVCFPSIGATAALVHAFAIADDIEQCFRFFQQLQRDKKGLPGLTQSNRRMWEEAIEAACRAGRTEWALQIFDEWKASSMSLMFLHPGDEVRPVKFPQLSHVTLAFLESCCRGSSQHEWRVYDVCAVMRQQKERKREAALDRPAKKSHHVADAA